MNEPIIINSDSDSDSDDSIKCISISKGKTNKLEANDAFKRPILKGWTRNGKQNIFYRTPDGLALHNLERIYEYLTKEKSTLRIDYFDFDSDVVITNSFDEQKICGLFDISRGRESIPIYVDGKISLADRSFKYMSKGYNFGGIKTTNNLGRCGCDCKDNCRDKLKCKCWQQTVQLLLNKSHGDCDYKSNRQISYENMRLMGPVISGIVECGNKCKCFSTQQCVNRVVQHGLQHELELFKTEEKGWGVRTKNDLPKGIFLTNYSGDVLEKSEADKRSTTYQFKLPVFRKDHSSNNNNSETEDSDDSSSDAESSGYNDTNSDSETDSDSDEPIPKKSKKALPSFRTSMKRGKVERYIIDGLDRGNISRFINHSCKPNIFLQNVYVDDDCRFPYISFFTNEVIKAGSELTIDYGYELIDGQEKECKCGATGCRGRLT